MCGIFGIAAGPKRPEPAVLQEALENLLLFSKSRGSEAAGLAALTEDRIQIYKDAVSPDKFLRAPQVKQVLKGALGQKNTDPLIVIGHSRMVTNGSQELHQNNQPVITEGVVGIHNGIVVNEAELWEQNADLDRKYEVDSEVLFSLLRKFYSELSSVPDALNRTFESIEGQASIAGIFNDLNCLVLASNNGSLYYLEVPQQNLVIFASEFGILQRIKELPALAEILKASNIVQLKAGDAALVNLEDIKAQHFAYSDFDPNKLKAPSNGAVRNIEDLISPTGSSLDKEQASSLEAETRVARATEVYGIDSSFSESLKRCTKCILPETMPYIEFDAEGVCNYCHNYKRNVLHGLDKLKALADSIRSKDGSPDCLLGLSGGRDSCYGLHYVKQELGLNPIAYTYDWGMVTDLARRNISRMCGKLGIEHILVSADIPTKRKFVRQNVNAWLKRPKLGTIPLFMAGDKAYFYHAERLKKEMDLPAIFLCECMHERTDFKSGYAGLRPKRVDDEHIYTLSFLNKLKLFYFYGKEYLLNPSYINSSILDTLLAYSYYYVMSKGYYNLYRYIPWIEEDIIDTLRSEYDWELSPDTVSTWRIGDGTASFYNYIYYKVTGFTENETFRSNQIREGLISREDALEKVKEENRPRFESIEWYCRTNGIDFEKALKVIDEIPRLK